MTMDRFEETPDLFGRGMGSGTTEAIICEWCGMKYPENDPSDDSVKFTNFGGKTIAECCFEDIEDAVLRRMNDIIPWFKRIIRSRRKFVQNQEDLLHDLKRAMLKK